MPIPKTIWFNRGHSVRNALMLIRRGGGGRVRLIASHPYPDAPALTAADVALIEPQGDGYVDWCLAVARERKVDLFVPGEHRDAIVARAADFASVGTRLAIPADPATLDLLDDKLAFTRAAAAAGLPVGETHVVRTAAEFRAAVASLAAAGHAACVKPRRGVYGAGFWRLAASGSLIDALRDPDARTIGTDTYAAALGDPAGEDLLVLQYLPGTETSVDILAKGGATIAAVARAKGRVSQALSTEGPAIDLARRTVATFELSGLVNVQMIADADGRETLIEVNTRMSGGCLNTVFAGINLPWWHVALELGLASPGDVPAPAGRATIASIPDAVRLDDALHATFSDHLRG